MNLMTKVHPLGTLNIWALVVFFNLLARAMMAQEEDSSSLGNDYTDLLVRERH